MLNILIDIMNKINLDCKKGFISYGISGFILYYYLNTIKNCDCVNKDYINKLEKSFMMSVLIYFLICNNMIQGGNIKGLLLILLILLGIYYTYYLRLLINDIYKKNCECADTTITYVMNILNYITIFKYIFVVCLLIMIYSMINN